ncbi:granulocyte-macrophage colony-stimulating factor receptor subunit alpha-like [Heteronotia binoei]|uniref:granulocyte-macrophage colony-stimulating factor receptor subunit alpha-like n=1 Tax=Heteronotia binoei TaxID=13085 RepID=UPI0029305408|nr:granulocyte-macrophage colony-stimulating factor receptor subunit alpha-like [Heteronotia binoei]
MVTILGFNDVIWLLVLYFVFYAALPNIQGSDAGYTEENEQTIYRCNLHGTVKKPSSVVLNWKVDLENMEMTWDPNVTMEECSVDTPPNKCDYGKPTETVCYFDNVQLHEGATFIAKIHYLNQTLSDSIYFSPEETDGTSAENFSCVLYNVSSVNCTWNVGRNAPEDVQYFLFMKYFGKDRKQKRECLHYINNVLGQHIACHIPTFEFDKDKYYIYVNGSSKKSQIQYYDVLLKLCHHERLGPPQTITKNCSKLTSKCIIQWIPPLNNENCCCLHYDIKDERKETPDIIFENYINIDMAERRIVRIRSVKDLNDYIVYGEWSEPIILDLPNQPIPLQTITLILLAVGTISMILILVFLCKRYRTWHKLIAPVPQPKDLFHQYSKNMEKELVDPIPTAHEPDEKITVIEEVTDGFKK